MWFGIDLCICTFILSEAFVVGEVFGQGSVSATYVTESLTWSWKSVIRLGLGLVLVLESDQAEGY